MNNRLARFALLLAIGLALSACSSSGGGASAAPSGDRGQSSPSSGSASPARIEVKLTDALKIEPATMTVKAGVPITFVVTNTGATDHEFYVGGEMSQADHAAQMDSMGGMGHDEANGIAVAPGATKELTITFPAAGTTLGGCHVNKHYDAGMKASITITA